MKWDTKLYNEKHAFVYRYGEELIKLLNPKNHERILDLGCGSGQLTAMINEYADKTIGMDKSSEMIAEAKHKFPNITFLVKDASHFTFEKRFDAIFSNATLHWVTNHKKAIQCMYKNLIVGGRIVVEFGGKGNLQTIISQLRRSLKLRGYTEQSQLDLWYFPTIGQYTTELELAGFRVLFAEHYDRPTEFTDKQSGIRDWLTTFANSFFVGISDNHTEEIMYEIQENIKNKCLINGRWVADYKRIRVVAVKE